MFHVPSHSSDDPSGETAAGAPRAASATTTSAPSFSGHLDPVIILKGQLKLRSILTDPERWFLPELPSANDVPRGPFWIGDYKALVEKEVWAGFTHLFTENRKGVLPDGSTLENGLFEIAKTWEVGRPIQAENPINTCFKLFSSYPSRHA